MTSPFEYREILRAQFRVNEERTVEQVIADQKARAADRLKRSGKVAPPVSGSAPKAELDAVRAMLQGVASPPLALPQG